MSSVLVASMVVGSLLAVLMLARNHYRSKLERWRDLIEPVGRDAAEAVEEQGAFEILVAEHAFEESERARHGLNLARAVRFLELALSVIEEATPGRLYRLRIMSRLVRMSMAILPLEAVPPERFRLRRVGFLARVGAALDAVLVAPAERMVVRLKVLTLGFSLTLHVLRASTKSAARHPDVAAAWERFRVALADWKALDEEHVRSLRAVLAAVAVEIKREAIAHQS